MSNISPLSGLEQFTVASLSDFAAAPVLVVAPHPDDETLGCGGAIALLRALGATVRVLVMSDGTKSHPNSRQYPAPILRQLRETETLAALSRLGVEEKEVTFLRLPDGNVPRVQTSRNANLSLRESWKRGLKENLRRLLGKSEGTEAKAAIATCQAYLTQFLPNTVFLPYQFDPHPDHRATWQLLRTAIATLPSPPRCLEYLIWDWEPGQRNAIDRSQYRAWRLDITDKVALKKDAIACYRSQTTDLINDDPEGFRLMPEIIANFTQPSEFYLERITDNS